MTDVCSEREINYFVETHGHLHALTSVQSFLDSTRENIRARSEQDVGEGQLRAIVCLADFPGCEGFERLVHEGSQLSDWSSVEHAPANELLFRRRCGDSVFVLSGRQIVSREGLEVLCFGLELCPDRTCLLDILKTASETDHFFILPWGAGKWLGARGKVLESVFNTDSVKDNIAFGDTIFRPMLWRSRHLVVAGQSGFPVLPGTDPLNTRFSRLSSGICGVSFSAADGCASALSLLRQHLFDARSYRPFGQHFGVWQFVRDQLALRMGK